MASGRLMLDEPERRREFLRMRRLATGLLVLMFAVFLAARTFETAAPWLSYVEAFAEAAMVGALADWFAVTALFRHPFGIPIPHTAIVPRNKDRLGRSLGNFIANNFLDREVLIHKLAQVDPARRVADWLSEDEHARFVADRVAAALPAVLDAADEEHVRAFMGASVVRSLKGIDVAPAGARVLSVLVAHRHHQALFDQMIVAAGTFLQENAETIRQKVAEKTAWWVPRWLDQRLFEKIIGGVEETLLELRDPEHPWRDQFNAAVLAYVERLASDPKHREKAAAIRDEILANPLVREYLDSVVREMTLRLRRDLQRPDSVTADALHHALATLGQRLKGDPEMLAILNLWIERAIDSYVLPHRGKIGAFISGVVERWDARTMVDKLEVQVGKDLQYIRINGTLVGGMVGLLIHALTTAAS